MSDDIVKRLRNGPTADSCDAVDLVHEAADEIERLQALASKQAQDIVTLGQLAGKAEDQRARIAALEGALKNIAGLADCSELRINGVWMSHRKIARAALAKGETG